MLTLPEILYTKEDLVITGSLSLYLQGYRDNFKDIDLVCSTVQDIPGAVIYRSASGHTTTDTKAYSKFYEKELDIFIEPILPEFIIINGLKVETIEHKLNHYLKIYDKVLPFDKQNILNRIQELQKIIKINIL